MRDPHVYIDLSHTPKDKISKEIKLSVLLLSHSAIFHITSIDGESRWSKFILHGIAVVTTMEEVALSIQQSYPRVLKLAQTPRWLITDAKRQSSGRGMSSVVLSTTGQHTAQSFGYQYLFVCNSRCRLEKYLPFGPSPQRGIWAPSLHVPRETADLRRVQEWTPGPASHLLLPRLQRQRQLHPLSDAV